MKKITIFTPTYNRAYILPKLKASLEHQDNYDFEWLIIDDGSTDETEKLVKSWRDASYKYEIRYYKVQNGGKPRAINKACKLAQTPWLFIVDSDDHLANNIIGFIIKQIEKIKDDKTILGIGGLRGHDSKTPWRQVPFLDYVIAGNLERSKYKLDIDCNEVYRIETLKHFPFEVWPGEIFTPEEIVLNEMSLSGYRLLWFNRVFVISEYLNDGMTKGSWQLIKRNPMGYAMLYNHKLTYNNSFSNKIYSVIQFIIYIIIGGNINYIKNCNNRFLAYFLFPIGWILSFRRKWQLKHFCK